MFWSPVFASNLEWLGHYQTPNDKMWEMCNEQGVKSNKNEIFKGSFLTFLVGRRLSPASRLSFLTTSFFFFSGSGSGSVRKKTQMVYISIIAYV